MEVYFSIGSNIGDRLNHLRNALEKLSLSIGDITAVSPVYESDPVGFESQEKFLNACVRLETLLSPFEVLATINHIERESGRERNNDGSYRDRTLDIDIILFGQKVLASEDLKIPHPNYTDRLFVLVPLNDINPHLTDPVSGVAISSLLKNCHDTSGITLTEHQLII